MGPDFIWNSLISSLLFLPFYWCSKYLENILCNLNQAVFYSNLLGLGLKKLPPYAQKFGLIT